MKFLAVRSIGFGVLTSAAVAITVTALAPLADSLGARFFSWPFVAFVVSGFPLSSVLDQIPAYDALLWRVFPEGGPGPAFTVAFFYAFVTWSAFFSAVWWLRLRKHRVAPNYSLKRTDQSLRD